MKRYKLIVPFALAVILFLSYYMLYDTRTQVKREYEQCLEQARELAEQGIAVDAVQNYSQALELRDTFDVNLEVGNFFLKVEDKASAINWGEQMIEKYPENAGAYEFLLGVHKGNSDFDNCFALYDTVQKREIVTPEIESIMEDIRYVYYFEEEFDEVSVFSNGLCPVQTEGKWGMVNEKGKRVVPYKYESIGAYMSDVAPVKTFEGECYFIDGEGNKKIVVQGVDNVQELSPMLNDVFAIYDGATWTYYNSKYEKISEGYDSVSVTGNLVAAVENKGNYKIVDNAIQFLGEQSYLDVVSDEKGIVYRNEALFVNINGSYFMIDKEGNKITNDEYINAKLFNDNTYAAVEGKKGWYFIDNTGKEVFKDKYFQDARSFSNGYAAVKLDGRWGFIDLEGNQVIDCVFEDAKDFTASGSVFVKFEEVWQLLKLYSQNYDA